MPMHRKYIDTIERLLAEEQGTVYKEPGGKISIALAYPNHYHVGMSSLGFQGIYGLLNSFSDVVCERVFLPDDDDYEILKKSRGGICSYESRRQLSRFDIVAFSVSFENDYPNVVKLLDLARIPRRRQQRSPHDPLLVLGGVCTFFNPEPLADFFDLCFVGEAEDSLQEFLDLYRAVPDRKTLLERAQTIEGIYLPGACEVTYDDEHHKIRRICGSSGGLVRKRAARNLTATSMQSTILTPHTEFSNMQLVEVMRGCPWSCRFCVAGQVYKPVRKKPPETVMREIESAGKRTSRVGLVGPSLSDYPKAEELLARTDVEFSITSLRASRRSADLVRLMQGRRSVSIAPEAGTARLRRVIDKRVTEDDIIETARLILEGDIDILRLYFMIGLPTETPDDISGIIDLARTIRNNSKKGSIALSVSTFVPKPFTPFQWHPMERLKTVKDRLGMLRKALGGQRGIRVLNDIPKYACMQAFFSLGDRRVSAAIEHLADNPFSVSGRIAGIDPADYLYRQKERDDDLPWDFLDAGIGKQKLWDEYQAALSVEEQ